MKVDRVVQRNLANEIFIILGISFVLIGIVFFLAAGYSWLFPSTQVSWTSRSDLTILGYNVYRWETNNRKNVRINDKLIPTDFDHFKTTVYSIEDLSLNPESIYHYQIQTVDVNGSNSLSAPFEIIPLDKTKQLFQLGLCISAIGLLAIVPSVLQVLIVNKKSRIPTSPECSIKL